MKNHTKTDLDLNHLLDAGSPKLKSGSPRRFPRWAGAVLTAIAAIAMAAAGFALGSLAAPAPEPEAETAPPLILELDPADYETVYENDYVTCYMYTEPLIDTYSNDSIALYDGICHYRLGDWNMEFALFVSATDHFNFWLRVELTEKGKLLYAETGTLSLLVNGAPIALDWNDTYLGTAPYYVGNSSTIDGWFVKGWLPRQTAVSLCVSQPGAETPLSSTIRLSPVVCGSYLTRYTTKELVEIVLNDRDLWKVNSGDLPEDLSDWPALLALSHRESCISILMDWLLSGPSTQQERALVMLKDSTFRSMMPSQLRKEFNTMINDWFTVTVYDYPLTQFQGISTMGHIEPPTYFRDNETSYRVSSEVPQALQGGVAINFWARVDLSAYYKSQYTGEWIMYAENEYRGAVNPQLQLGVREYYDDAGNVAGWFVYGHIPNWINIDFWLDGSTPGNIADYSVVLFVSPTGTSVIPTEAGWEP